MVCSLISTHRFCPTSNVLSLLHTVLYRKGVKHELISYSCCTVCCTRQGVERKLSTSSWYCCIRQGVELSQYSCVVGCLCNVPLDMIAFIYMDVTQLASSLSVHPPSLQVWFPHILYITRQYCLYMAAVRMVLPWLKCLNRMVPILIGAFHRHSSAYHKNNHRLALLHVVLPVGVKHEPSS